MCTGRIELSFILRAFAGGADGVIIGGCWPGECHYVTEGNYDALANVHLCRRLMEQMGMSPERLRIEWIAASEGTRFAEVMNAFVKKQKELGPLAQEVDATILRRNLEAARKLVPYLKLVESQRLRVTPRTEKAINAFYDSDEATRLFEELIADRFTMSQILVLLGDGPLSTREISDKLSLEPSRVSRHMNESSRHGLVRYDVECNRYALT